MERLDMGTQAVTHDRDQLLVDLILVLLVVLQGGKTAQYPRHPRRRKGDTYPFQLVELDKHDRLFLAQMPPERLPDVRDERDNNRQRLRGQGWRVHERRKCLSTSAHEWKQ